MDKSRHAVLSTWVALLLLILTGSFAVKAQGGGDADRIVLVEKGQARCSIVAPAELSETLAKSVAQLQEYIWRMSGTPLSLTTDNGLGTVLSVGRTEALMNAGLEQALAGLGSEGFIIRTHDDDVFLAGATDLGTQNAVYTFLELLGCRWFAPGKAWEVVPHRRSISIGPIDIRQQPTFQGRLLWYAWGSRLPQKARDEVQDWYRRNKQIGAWHGSIGHAYAQIANPEQHFAEHPEWFPMIDGERVPRGQLCTSNPEVIERAIEYARRFFRDNPDATVVSLSPNDGGGYCECPKCEALGSISDRTLIFANQVADAIRDEFPGKYVAFYAYYLNAPPPTVDGRDNVIVYIATRFITGGYTFEQLVEGWSKHVKHLGIRDYYSVLPWNWGLPVNQVRKIQGDLKYYRDHGVIAVSAESEDNWAPQGQNYYTAAKLMWDVDADLNAILDDYYEKCWERAAGPMRRYYERWADGKVTKNALACALADLDEATRLEPAGTVRRRLDLLKLYLHHVILHRRYNTAPPHDADALREAARRLVEFDWRIIPYDLIDAIPFVDVYIRRELHKKLPDITDEEIDSWKSNRLISRREIDELFTRDRTEIQPLGVARRVWGENLKPVDEELVSKGKPSQPLYRSENRFLIYAPARSLEMEVQAGLIRDREADIVLLDLARKEIGKATVPPGDVSTISFDLPAPGLYRLETRCGGGAVRIDFGSLSQALIATESEPAHIINGTPNLYFWVPPRTTAFGVGLSTSDRWGRLIVRDPKGGIRLDRAGNFALTEEFRVDVPEGEDGRIWSLGITECEDSDMYLIGVPPYLSQKPDAVLVPR